MLLRICKLSVELFCCLVADFQFRVHHVEGVDVAVVNVQFCVDVVFLQFMYVSHGFCKKTALHLLQTCRPAADQKSLCTLPEQHRSVPWFCQYFADTFSRRNDFSVYSRLCRDCPGMFPYPGHPALDTMASEKQSSHPCISRFHAYSDTQPAAGTFSTDHDLIRSDSQLICMIFSNNKCIIAVIQCRRIRISKAIL